VHTAPAGTRFVLVLKVRSRLRSSAVLRPRSRRASRSSSMWQPDPGWPCSLHDARGHALDRDQPRVLAPLVDLAHTTSAAVWLGGLLGLIYVLPRATDDAAARAAAVRRFSTAALVAVSVLALSGLAARSQSFRGAPDLVDVVRTRADREDRALRTAARPWLAEPHGSDRAFARLRRSAPPRWPAGRVVIAVAC